MAQEVKTDDITLEKWAEKTFDTNQEATHFVKSLGEPCLLSTIALTYTAKQISGHFGVNAFVTSLCQALKPFWDQEQKRKSMTLQPNGM